MNPRQLEATVLTRLADVPAVDLLDARQCGKSILARSIGAAMPGALMVDLEITQAVS